MSIESPWIAALGLTIATLLNPISLMAQDRPDQSIEAVRAVLKRQVDDWNKGDLDGFLTGYWNSPRVVFQSGGQRFDGWEAMRNRYRKRYQSEGRAMGRLEFTGLEIEPLGPETALACGEFRLTMPDGSRPAGLFTVIFRKLPEGWKIIHDHTSAQEPAQSKPATTKAVP